MQHAFREDRELASVAAGLRSSVHDVLSHEVPTFVRRAERFHLSAVADEDVAAALREPIEAAGRSMADDALGWPSRAPRRIRS